MMDKTIQIVNSVAADDPLDWIRDHPAFAGDDFEVICAALPIPGGGEIPLLGLSGGGVTTLVDRSTGHPRRDLERMARSISFLRRDGEWVSRSFPDRVFRQIEKPRLIVMISDTDEAFLESLHGLALSRLSIVRARNVQSADGMCALLVEKEKEWNYDTEQAVSPDDLTTEELEFFKELEGELLAVRNQRGVR